MMSFKRPLKPSKRPKMRLQWVSCPGDVGSNPTSAPHRNQAAHLSLLSELLGEDTGLSQTKTSTTWACQGWEIDFPCWQHKKCMSPYWNKFLVKASTKWSNLNLDFLLQSPHDCTFVIYSVDCWVSEQCFSILGFSQCCCFFLFVCWIYVILQLQN